MMEIVAWHFYFYFKKDFSHVKGLIIQNYFARGPKFYMFSYFIINSYYKIGPLQKGYMF